MSNKNTLQNEVFLEFKQLAEQIGKTQSFPGLLMQQQKIQELYEKFIFLKQLQSSKIEHFMQEINEVKPAANTVSEPAAVQRDFSEVSEKINDPEPEISEKTTVISTEEKKEEIKIDEVSKPEETHKKLSVKGIEIAEYKPKEPKENPSEEQKTNTENIDIHLNPIKLDFNDSIAFISQLFEGSKAKMDEEIKKLNETKSISDSKNWIEEMFHKYQWQDKQEYVERLSELILNRFS